MPFLESHGMGETLSHAKSCINEPSYSMGQGREIVSIS